MTKLYTMLLLALMVSGITSGAGKKGKCSPAVDKNCDREA